MTKPRSLELFARAQGTAVGMARAGFAVTASDIRPYDKHPEVEKFFVADALDVLDDVEYCRTFDVITAGPPCQGYSNSRHLTGREYGGLIEPVREKLERIGRPYVIENVEGARKELRDPLKLCGSMFGLGTVCRDGQYRQLRRHRLFESTHPIPQPEGGCQHYGQPGGVYGTGGGGQMTRGYKFRMPVMGVYGHGGTSPGQRGYAGTKAEAAEAMGIDWMRRDDLSQAIPPVYAQWIGCWLKLRL